MLLKAVICLCVGFTLGFEIIKDSPPEWSPVYTVKAVLNIPYAELKEPIYAWYDSKNGKSRIDYYGGMAKTYQIKNGGSKLPYGTMFKVVPVTTEQYTNKIVCFESDGDKNMSVGIQPTLPDLTGFTFYGTENMVDSNTTKWRLVHTEGKKINKYTMWVKYRKTLGGVQVPIPVRYEMKGVNTLYGSHYDHYYLDYEDYNVDDIDSTVFDIDKELKCRPFSPDSGKHRATFNPMGEFMHPANEDHVHSEFDRFKRKHNRNYPTEDEHHKRLNIFRQNLRFIQSKNRARLGFTLAVNHLADRTDDELAVMRGKKYSGPNSGLPFPYTEGEIERMNVKLPPEFDWRLFGAVTPVKDQSVCGSCWSFGTTGAVEGALFLHNGGTLVRLSQQALVDCSWGFGNNGCDGGEDFRSYQWIMKHGLPTEDDYGGYLGADGYCHIDNVTLITSIKGWVNVTTNNENALRLAIFKHGPISIAIDASPRTFSYYSNGVYYDPNCHNKLEQLDHAVLAVGYGILNGQKYWLVKNSWSNMWGNDGYILISSRDNNCGVETAPTYVLI